MTRNPITQLRRQNIVANEFAEKIDKSYDFSRDGEAGTTNGLWSEEIQAWADTQTLSALFFSEDWVFIAIDVVAQKLSSVALNIVRKEPDKDGNLVSEKIPDHALVPLIQMPNPWQEYASWMYNYVTQDALSGNGVNWFAKKAGHMIVIPSSKVTLKADDKGRLDTYWINIGSMDGGVASAIDKQGFALPANEIAHVRRPNPESLLWGLSPLVPGRKPVLFNRYSGDYLNSFYLKQATPGMAIEMERTVNEELALRQLASFEMAYTGRRNARRTLLLPKGTSAKPLTHTLADQKLVDMLGMNRETLINLYSIPKHEVGLQESGSLGSEEHRIALKNFWMSELIPTGHRIEGSLTQFFRHQKLLEPDEFFEFDFESVEALQDDLMQKAEIAEKMAQTLPLNTVIAKVWKEEPIDDPRAELPLSLAPTGGVSVSTTDEEVSEVREQARDDERESDGDEQPGTEDDNKSIASRYLAKHGDWLQRTNKALEDEVTDAGEQIEDLTLDLFVDFTEKAIEVVRRSLKTSAHQAIEMVPAGEGEMKPKAVGPISMKIDKPSDAILRRRLEREFDDLEEQYVDEYSDVLAPTIEVGYDTQMEFVFDEPKREDIEVLRARDEKGRKATLSARGLEAFASISKTTSKKIVTEIANGVEAQETLPQIVKRIADKINEGGIARAKTIARTETLTAASIGQNAAFENTSEVSPGTKKMWLNSEDLRVRGNPNGKFPNAKDDHWEMQGEIIEKGQTFSNGLEYPRDVKSDDPAKVINCRCTMALLPPGFEIEE